MRDLQPIVKKQAQRGIRTLQFRVALLLASNRLGSPQIGVALQRTSGVSVFVHADTNLVQPEEGSEEVKRVCRSGREQRGPRLPVVQRPLTNDRTRARAHALFELVEFVARHVVGLHLSASFARRGARLRITGIGQTAH